MMNLILLFITSAFAVENHYLAEGDLWRTETVKSVWIEDGSVLQGQQLGSQTTIRALKAGQSEFRIGEAEHLMSVLTRNQMRSYRQLVKLTERTLGLRAELSPQGPQVLGRLLRLEDLQYLANNCRSCEYQLRTQIGVHLQKAVRQEVQRKLKKISSYPYRLEFSEVPKITVPAELAQKNRIRKALQPFGIEVLEDAQSIEMTPLVKVQITVAEMRRSSALKFGMEWPESYKAQLVAAPNQAADPLSVSLHALEKNGFGKILASPNLMVKSGQQAEFLAGGEIPIKIVNARIQDVIWKKYGILLKVKPKADYSGRMSISIETEVSTLDESRTIDGIPGFLTNRLQSYFDLSESRTIALSGLLKRETGQSQGSVPLLSRLPILGELFSSRDYRESRTELVVFVRPEIMNYEESQE